MNGSAKNHNKTAVTHKEMKEVLSEHFWAHSFLVAQHATGFLQHHKLQSSVLIGEFFCSPDAACLSLLGIQFPLRLLRSVVNTLMAHAYPQLSKLNKRACNKFYT